MMDEEIFKKVKDEMTKRGFKNLNEKLVGYNTLSFVSSTGDECEYYTDTKLTLLSYDTTITEDEKRQHDFSILRIKKPKATNYSVVFRLIDETDPEAIVDWVEKRLASPQEDPEVSKALKEMKEGITKFCANYNWMLEERRIFVSHELYNLKEGWMKRALLLKFNEIKTEDHLIFEIKKTDGMPLEYSYFTINVTDNKSSLPEEFNPTVDEVNNVFQSTQVMKLMELSEEIDESSDDGKEIERRMSL